MPVYAGKNGEAGADVQELIPTMLVEHQFGDLALGPLGLL
jgi:hypothetical protein